MELDVKIPSVGESVNEVIISNWLKDDGDYVEMDEAIAEIESEKATLELTAEKAGSLKIIIPADETLAIGTTVAKIDTEATGPIKVEKVVEKVADKNESVTIVADPSLRANIPLPKKIGVVDMLVPSAGESLTEVTIGAWLKKDGDYIMIDEPLAEIESEKATLELMAEQQGVLKINANEGETVAIGSLICQIDTDKEAPADYVLEAASIPETTPTPIETKTVTVAESGKKTAVSHATGHPSPAAGKIMNEKGLSPAQISGTGKDGRITKQDVLDAIQNIPAGSGFDINELLSNVSSNSRDQEKKKMSPLRKTIAKRLVAAKNQTAMLTTFNEVNMKPVIDIRNAFKKKFEEKHDGTRLGFMSFFLKACSIALQEFPQVNAQIDGDQMIFNNFTDISIAVSTPKGLVVPVIRNSESMSLKELEDEVRRLALKGRDGKLSMDEMTGGTFTITNGGVFGSLISTPIINQPQSAILGMHSIQDRPMAVNGQVVILPMMYLAVSYDHRIIDGKESVSFLVRVKELLENPEQMLLGKNPIEALLGL